MPEINVWDGDGFTLESLTAAINNMPYRPGQIGALGVFDEDGVTTTMVSIEERNGKLSLIEPTPRGGPGETTDDEDRNKIPFEVDHYQRDDFVKADEVQNVREFGTSDVLETLQGRIERRGQRHAQDLTMTLEHQRVGAIKGIVTAKSGKVLHNLYDRFALAVPAAVSLELDVDATDVMQILQDVTYSIEDDLDEPYEGIHYLTGRDLHAKLWRHKSVKDTFLNTSGAIVLRQDVPDVFTLGSNTFERYRTGAKATADLGSPYVATNEARGFPKGVPELFITRFAPADYEETVNTVGLPYYMKQYAAQNGKGRHLEVQSNPISLCTKPKVLRKLTLT